MFYVDGDVLPDADEGSRAPRLWPKRALQERKEWDEVKIQARCRWQGADDLWTMIMERGVEPGVGWRNRRPIMCYEQDDGSHVSLMKSLYRWQNLISQVIVGSWNAKAYPKGRSLHQFERNCWQIPLITTVYSRSFRLSEKQSFGNMWSIAQANHGCGVIEAQFSHPE